MEYTEIKETHINRISYKEQFLDNHDNKGKSECKPGRVRPRTPFMKQIMKDAGIRTYKEFKRIIVVRKNGRINNLSTNFRIIKIKLNVMLFLDVNIKNY